jgi:hypothetical protein
MRRRSLSLALALTAFLGSAPVAHADPVTFNFGSVPQMAVTPFSMTQGGITATFDSTVRGGFGVFPSAFFQSLGPQVLIDPTAGGANDLPLQVSFDRPLSSMTLNFALNANSGTFTVTALKGETTVGTSTSFASIAGGGSASPEGVAFFSGATFDAVRLSSDTLDFAVNNITVQAADVPEPATLTLVGLGALGLVGYRLRRRQGSPAAKEEQG